MIAIRIMFEDGSVIATGFNGSLEEATKYYVGQKFELHEDGVLEAVYVELIADNDNRHYSIIPLSKFIYLPVYRIIIRNHNGTATISSDLESAPEFDAIEALILAHACAGVDVTSQAYVDGIITVVDAIVNHS